MYVNSVAVVGNLTADPRMGEGDGKVVNLRLGVSRPGRGREVEVEDTQERRTEFIDVECWGSQADHIYDSLHRGDRVIVAGQLKYDRWSDPEGNPRSRVCIRAAAVGPSLEFKAL